MAQRASQFALGRDKKTPHTKQERLNKRAVQHVLVVIPNDGLIGHIVSVQEQVATAQ